MDIIITGATGGLGRCLVQKAIDAKTTSNIFCIYRNQNKFDSLFPTPCSKLKPIEQLYHNTTVSKLACILTGFSIEPIKTIGTFREKEIYANLQVNIQEIVMLVNRLAALSISNNVDLRIINIDSGAAYKPIKGWSLYCAAKAYINMFLRTLCIENNAIKAVTYEPGVMDTDMQSIIRMSDEKVFDWVGQFKGYHSQSQLNAPSDVADDIFSRFIECWSGNDFQTGYYNKHS